MRIVCAMLLAHTVLGQVKPYVSQRTASNQVQVVRVAPRFASAIRLSEPVSAVVAGDPSRFLVEHSEKEPMLVLVKPVVDEAAESNLLITTTLGRQLSFLLRSSGAAAKNVDFVMFYKTSASFVVEESALTRSEISETRPVLSVSPVPAIKPTPATVEPDAATPLDRLLERQSQAGLPQLYGAKPPAQPDSGDRVRAGVSEVIDHGRAVIVLFSVVNPQAQAVELLPPQIQLAGRTRTGGLIRKDRWTTSEQLPVEDFRLTRRRLGPRERADGVAVFRRPAFKQSNETVYLQMAESGAVDMPALAPIGFGVSAVQQEAKDDE